MKKHFQTYNELNEALKLSQYRYYHDMRPENLEKKLSSYFKGKNRIYIPFEYKVTDSDIIRNPLILDALEKEGYTITNYLEGYCEKDGRTFRIGKVLNQLNRLDLLKTFNEDPNRAVQNKDFLICISKHPYDIAGMSTDRGWTSCMNLEDGSNAEYIENEIVDGTLIAYLIDEKDKNINRPYGRINIKPYTKKERYIAWGLANYCYGSLLHEKEKPNGLTVKFKSEIESWVDKNLNKKKQGIYRLKPYVYHEAPEKIYLGDKNTSEYLLHYWKIDLSKIEDGVYNGDIYVPEDLKEFRGFKEELGLDIKEIGGYLSFNGCTSLTSVSNLPEYVGRDLSFKNCKSLTSVSNLPEKINMCLDFRYCTSLSSVSNLPKTIHGDLSFDHCTSLTSVSNLPEIVGGFLSFNGCTSLTSVSNLPEKIGWSLSFRNCISLMSLPNTPSEVKGDIYTHECPFFEGMTEEDIRKKYKISPIHKHKFELWKMNISNYKDGIYTKDIYVPVELKEFKGFEEELGLDIKEVEGSLLFYNCNDLTSVSNLPENVGGFLSFEGCDNLVSVSDIPLYAHSLDFKDCNNLTHVSNFPKRIKNFFQIEYCMNLSSIPELPSYVGKDIIIKSTGFTTRDYSELEIRKKYKIEPIYSEGIREWKIDFSKLKDGVYDGDLKAPKDIKEFKGFEEILGLDIKEITGNLIFSACTSLTSISNLPEKVGESLNINLNSHLKTISNFPKTIGEDLNLIACTDLNTISNLPDYVGQSIRFTENKNLKTILGKFPSVVKYRIITTENIPFFKGMTEEQIREKYNISK